VVDFVLFFVLSPLVILFATQTRDRPIDAAFRKAFILEVTFYLAIVVAVLVIASEFFGPYIHWIAGLLTLLAIPIARKGYPNFLKIWRLREPCQINS
jgi:hypothetical protein